MRPRYITSRPVNQYDLEGNLIGEYRSVRNASNQTGCSQEGIRKTCLGLKKRVKGFRFEYVNKDVSTPISPLVKKRKLKKDLSKSQLKKEGLKK